MQWGVTPVVCEYSRSTGDRVAAWCRAGEFTETRSIDLCHLAERLHRDCSVVTGEVQDKGEQENKEWSFRPAAPPNPR